MCIRSIGSLIVVVLLGICLHANADNRKGWYAGGGANILNSSELREDGDDISFAGFELLAGYKYDAYLGIEVRVGFGTRGADNSTATKSVSVDVTDYEGLYYRMEAISDKARLYGIIGATRAATKRIDDGVEIIRSSAGIGAGVGVGFFSGERTNLNVEYRQYLNNSENAFSGLAINLDYRFK